MCACTFNFCFITYVCYCQEIDIGGVVCPNAALQSDEITLTCQLPAGTGQNVNVIVRTRIDAKSALESTPRPLLGYNAPRIASMAHPACVGAGTRTLTACPRAGQGRLSLTGSDFGSKGAVVLVGADLCTNVVHDEAHTGVSCLLPMGTTLAAPVLLIQSGGAVSPTGNIVAFTQCPVISFQNNMNLGLSL